MTSVQVDELPVAIECLGCPSRGQGCGDCVVAAMLTRDPGVLVAFDEAEQGALSALAAAGLLPPARWREAEAG